MQLFIIVYRRSSKKQIRVPGVRVYNYLAVFRGFSKINKVAWTYKMHSSNYYPHNLAIDTPASIYNFLFPFYQRHMNNDFHESRAKSSIEWWFYHKTLCLEKKYISQDYSEAPQPNIEPYKITMAGLWFMFLYRKNIRKAWDGHI